MTWRYWAYKAGQVIGAGGVLFIALWLIGHPSFEPNPIIRWMEIVFSLIAFIILGCDALDLNPAED